MRKRRCHKATWVLHNTRTLRRILENPTLQLGETSLDDGCGPGGLALHLDAAADVNVTGLTLSAEQLRIARSEAARRGLSERVEFHLQDYCKHHGRYDRIVSVGMFEHVGRRNLGRYFDQLASQLRPHRIALLHTIGSTRPPNSTNAWVRRHIFSGGHIPSLSALSAVVERSRLVIGDIETLRPHYAATMIAPRQRISRYAAAAPSNPRSGSITRRVGMALT